MFQKSAKSSDYDELCEIPGKIREIRGEKWRNRVKICKHLRKFAKFDEILKIGAKACKISQIFPRNSQNVKELHKISEFCGFPEIS